MSNKTHKHRVGFILGALLGVAVLVLMVLYQIDFFVPDRIAPGKTELPPSQMPAGESFFVKLEEVPVIYESVGTVRSRDEVAVSARIIARIEAVTVRIGDAVKKGDILVRLGDSDLRARANQVRERYAADAAAVKGAADNVERARAAMDYALIQQKRMRTLFAENAVARKQLDEAELAARQATAAWRQASQAQRTAESQQAATGQALKEAEAQLAFATLVSPMDGIVSDRSADPGDLASPGRVLLRIFNPTTLRLEVPVRESLVKAIQLEAKVLFDVPALNRRFEGEVREIVPAVDPGSRTFMVKICFGRDPKSELWPGMFGTLKLPLASQKALLIPENAVRRTGQLEYVLSRVGGQVRRVLVRTMAGPNGTRKVLTGLRPGAEVLLPKEKLSASPASWRRSQQASE